MKVASLSLVLLLLIPAAGWAQALPGDVLCDDDLLICRESCSMELGTRATNREKVARCLYRCEQSHTVCLQRQIAKRQAAPRANEAPAKKKPEEKAEHFSGSPTRFSQEETPEAAEEVAPVKRTVTRSTQLEAAPEHDPAGYPEREGFVSKGGPTRADREAVQQSETIVPEKPAVEDSPPPAAPDRRRRTTNELGY